MPTLGNTTNIYNNSTSSANLSTASNIDILSMLSQYRGSHGQLDTSTLAKDWVTANQQDSAKANDVFQAISEHLYQKGELADVGNFQREVQNHFKSVSTSSSQKLGLTQEQINKMSPADVVKYWASGKGGDLYFGPDSKISQIFAKGNGAAAFEKFLYDKFGGNPQHLDRVDDFAYKFTAERVLSTTNSAEHIVGSWSGGTAIVVDQQILFRANNAMTVRSFFYGRPLSDMGLPSFGSYASDLKMTIEWTSPLRTNQ